MSDAERNYDVREKEFMALFRACVHWRHYLHGTQPFQLMTDHDSLKYHKTMPNLSGRLARWIEKMAEFDYKLAHIPGKDNVVADALSRRADYHSLKPASAALNGILKRVSWGSPNLYEPLRPEEDVAKAEREEVATLAAARVQHPAAQPFHRQHKATPCFRGSMIPERGA